VVRALNFVNNCFYCDVSY